MPEGRISSIETMGLVDGPGIRVVVFFAGCRLRCRFCHNPDTWNPAGGRPATPDELMQKIRRMRVYFSRSGGGVTFSGGEPLLQPDFLLELLRRCRAEGIHTCVDTAGVGAGRYDEILSLTDLVLYDVKALDHAGYRALCGAEIDETERFQSALRQSGVRTIVRQVVVPGVNDSDDYMRRLQNYIQTHIPTAESVELLPYHKMGVYKYEALHLADPLSGTPAMDPARTEAFYQTYFQSFKRESDDK